eukprot:4032879-Pyramimonas_sp.AAC.1
MVLAVRGRREARGGAAPRRVEPLPFDQNRPVIASLGLRERLPLLAIRRSARAVVDPATDLVDEGS